MPFQRGERFNWMRRRPGRHLQTLPPQGGFRPLCLRQGRAGQSDARLQSATGPHLFPERETSASRRKEDYGYTSSNTEMSLTPLTPRTELDEEALADIRLALLQGQPLGQGRFGDQVCAALGVRRTQKKPGRPAGKTDQSTNMGLQTDFGF